LATERSFDEILFGEPLERITCGKLLQVLQSVEESPVIEFKTWVGEVGEKNRGYEEDNKSLILKPVTAFLNSPEGRGLLIIGVRGKERFEGWSVYQEMRSLGVEKPWKHSLGRPYSVT